MSPGLARYPVTRGVSFVQGTPVRYTDPTGNKPCDGNVQNASECKSVTSSDILEAIRSGFRWYVNGRWTKNELYKLMDTGIDIEAKVSCLTNGNGRGWMLGNMGETVFIHDPVSEYVLDRMSGSGFQIGGIVPSGLPVILLAQGGMTKQTIAHELAHVWDINSGDGWGPANWFGGGPADALTKFVGGNPSGIRWGNGTSGIPYAYQWSIYASGWGYGNQSTADYFAEAFTWMIYDPTAIPQPDVLSWLQSLISLIGNQDEYP